MGVFWAENPETYKGIFHLDALGCKEQSRSKVAYNLTTPSVT
jgi:hypothetical protein